jgi:hypothetical protein
MPNESSTSEVFEFEFEWIERGVRKSAKINARSYSEACWRLGIAHGRRFDRSGAVPPGFEIQFSAPPLMRPVGSGKQ